MFLTIEKHLENLCKDNEEYILYSVWQLNKKVYAELLQNIILNFSNYSRHDVSHSKNIVNNIEMFLGEDRIQELGVTETWLLLECAYNHDIGMVVDYYRTIDDTKNERFRQFLRKCSDSGNTSLSEASDYILNIEKYLDSFSWLVKSRKYVNELMAEFYRPQHSELSEKYILHNSDLKIDLGHNHSIKDRLFYLMGKIALNHGRNFDSVINLPYEDNGEYADKVHPRFISAMIRLGDLLDLDNNRFNNFTEIVAGEFPELSKAHKQKHASVKHFSISPEGISISCNCETQEAYIAQREWLTWLEEVNNLLINWSEIIPVKNYGNAPKIIQKEILIQNKKDTIGKASQKLIMEQKDIFDIIEGSNLYKDNWVFIREVFQNAVDASNMLLWQYLKEGVYNSFITTDVDIFNINPHEIDERVFKNFHITIDIIENNNGTFIFSIEDKGIGIDDKNFINMTKVGRGWSKRELINSEIEKMPKWLQPSGRFGIGLQSVFLVSDKITIETKSLAEKTKEIIIHSGRKEGIISITESDKRETVGTNVMIKIKEEINSYNLVKVNEYRELRSFDYFDTKFTLDMYLLLGKIREQIFSTYFPVYPKFRKF